jgi:sugar diacid utilization regulator
MRLLDLETTFSVFLDSDSRVDSAAARLNVHPNTLRHRLKRYDEVSGPAPDPRRGHDPYEGGEG